MRHHLLERRQAVRRPPAEAFEFFSDAFRLEEITPPWLGFRVVSRPPIDMRAGALIDYCLRLHGIPVRWRTRIEVWEPGRRFVDVQIEGPYRLWHHLHEFEPDGHGGTVIRDAVRYSMPFGPLGALAHAALVRRDLKRIFDFRRDAVQRIMGASAS